MHGYSVKYITFAKDAYSYFGILHCIATLSVQSIEWMRGVPWGKITQNQSQIDERFIFA